MRTDYEALANQPETSHPEAVILKAALELHEARKRAVELEVTTRQVANVDAVVTDAVAVLRAARKAEAKAKAYLRAVGAAADAFKSNGDYTVFCAARGAALATMRTS